jgi:hypothetical protein
MGWRYLLFTLGGLTLILWALRFAVFPLYESPRYLIGRGKDAEAVDVIHKVATYNGTSTDLTVDMLNEAAREVTSTETTSRRLLNEDSNYHMKHLRALFSTPKMAWSTLLLITIWGEKQCYHCETSC